MPPDPESDTESLTAGGRRSRRRGRRRRGRGGRRGWSTGPPVAYRTGTHRRRRRRRHRPGGRRRRRRPGRWVPWTALAVYAAFRVATVVAVAVADLSTHNSLLSELDIWDGAWFLRDRPPRLPGPPPRWPTGTWPPTRPPSSRCSRWSSGPSTSPACRRVVALVVSAVTGATAVYGVGLLARRLAGDAAGQRAALLFAVFPGTFVFSLGYSEGIVITCVSLGLLALLGAGGGWPACSGRWPPPPRRWPWPSW